MRFGVLGPVAVWDETGREVPVPGTKVRKLLALLLVADGSPVSADRVADALWGDAPPPQPAKAVKSKVSQLRRVLRDAGCDASAVLPWSPGGYRLLAAEGDLDSLVFRASVERARRSPDTNDAFIELAVALRAWRGTPFGEFRHEPFALAPAADLEETRLEALELRAARRIATGSAAAALSDLTRLAGEHPLRESLHALLMRAYGLTDRQADAHCVYTAVRERLADDLGVDPGPALKEAHAWLLRLDEAEAPTVAHRPVHAPAPSPPAPPEPFIGREDDSARVAKLLSQYRSVTVTGPGGVGKTSLALRAAADREHDFPDGVHFIDLGGVRGGYDEVVRAMAEALGVRDDQASGTATTAEPVGLWFRFSSLLLARRSLLVLDNAEHLAGEVAKAVSALVRDTSEVRVLVTSREPLHSPGERTVVLDCLAAPPPGTPVEDACRYPAVQLLFDRIEASGADLADGRETMEAVVALAHRLDGLPLALELAAARVRSMGLSATLDRLDDRFRLLRGGSRHRPERHRTLEAVIAWSWGLTAPSDREALARMAVSPAPWRLDDLEAVVGPDVLDSLDRLVDQSMVVMEETEAGPEYRLLESVRAFAEARGGDPEHARRHAEHFSRVAGDHVTGIRAGGQESALRVLTRLGGHLRRILDGDPSNPLALRLVWYWILTGRLTEARERLTALGEDPEAAAWLASLRWRVDDEEPAGFATGPAGFLPAFYLALTARSRGAGARPVLPEPSDEWETAAESLVLALDALSGDDPAGAEGLARAGGELFASLGDEWGELQVLDVRSRAAEERGDDGEAEASDRRALDIADRLGLHSDLSRLLTRLGRRAMAKGDVEEAGDLLRRALRISGEQCDTAVYAEAHEALRECTGSAGPPPGCTVLAPGS
ncbi:AfsR/SARP family transcriptional regulator [Salininema proteolyticum]|uniref:BTAD domain-containing putative transcriptional regulator n=1 Tax=Salininema proteolyticum TaxID=1607685 RepID=A0ABV8TZ91_9ACTN